MKTQTDFKDTGKRRPWGRGLTSEMLAKDSRCCPVLQMSQSSRRDACVSSVRGTFLRP